MARRIPRLCGCRYPHHHRDVACGGGKVTLVCHLLTHVRLLIIRGTLPLQPKGDTGLVIGTFGVAGGDPGVAPLLPQQGGWPHLIASQTTPAQPRPSAAH